MLRKRLITQSLSCPTLRDLTDRDTNGLAIGFGNLLDLGLESRGGRWGGGSCGLQPDRQAVGVVDLLDSAMVDDRPASTQAGCNQERGQDHH